VPQTGREFKKIFHWGIELDEMLMEDRLSKNRKEGGGKKEDL